MTKYEVLKMFEGILKRANGQFAVGEEPTLDALLDIIDDEILVEGERGHWPLSQ